MIKGGSLCFAIIAAKKTLTAQRSAVIADMKL